MAQYTTLSPEELADIVSQYSIGIPLKTEDIPGGYGNSNFKLTTSDGVYLLKICDEKDIIELQLQVSILEHLKQHEYPTVYPIPQKCGNILHTTQNYSVMIFPYIKGDTPNPSRKVLTQIGEALAQLHCIFSLDNLPKFPMGLAQITPYLDEVKETHFGTHPFHTWLKSELEWIGPELDRPLPTGLLHGDLFLDNTLFKGEKMLAILDFEEVCYDTFLIDVGMTIIGCCYTAQHQLDMDSVVGFLDAYNSIRSLTDEEWSSLDTFVHYAALSIAFWRFRQFNIRHPNDKNSDSYLEMITRSDNWQSI